ncbi:MAG: hypothetical protein IPL46_00635 [Saprospiraceae bacterium]|nr:hypothetical protein [Saprospiraceae bacterium]
MTIRICTIIFLVSLGVSAQGSIVTWVVGIDGSWEVPGNWVGGAIPTANDSVVIAGGR